MTGVFISYSRKDSAIAQKLMKEFKSIELDVWVDWEDIPPAVGWLDQILQGIEQADAFVFLISPDSVASEVCNVELAHAHKNAKRIIPIMVRDVDPKTTVHIIRDLNWIFLREKDDFDAGLEKVKKAINLDINWLQEHRRLQVRALDWDRKKDLSLLLRGSDLRDAVKMIALHETGDPKPSELQNLYISFSRRNERVRTITWVSAAAALIVMVMLSFLALTQRQAALVYAAEAQKQTTLAKESESLAKDNARAALAAKAAADKNAKIAKAQRSAARAQIFQSRTGGLFTSTLLALDSYQGLLTIDSYPGIQSTEAEGILRKNISLLPIPVAQLEQKGPILHIEVSPDGSSFMHTSEDGTACLTRFEDGKSLFCVESSGPVLDAVFSPDGKLVVTSDANGEVRILNVENGEVLKELNFGVSVRDVNVSPDGRLLAMARDDGRITLIKLPSYDFSAEFSVFGSLRVTAFSPDGLWFAAASDIGSITFWNLGTGKIVNGGAHRDEVFDIAFSPDSRKLISGSADNCAILTSPSSGKQLLKVLNEEAVVDVAFSPDGDWFVTASNDFRIRVWDTNSGEERLRFLQDSLVSDVKVSPDGLWIASTGSDRTVRVWSAANGAEMFQIPLSTVGNVLEFSADNHYLVTGDADGHVAVWDISALKMNVGFLRFDDFVRNIEMSPSGDWYAASTKGQVWVLNPELSATQTALQGNPILDLGLDVITDLEIDPQGKQIAVSTESGKVVVVDVPGGGTRTLVNSGPMQKLAFSPDGTSLILGSEDGLLQQRSITSGENGVLWQGTSAIYSLSISTSNQIALGTDNQIVLLGLGSNTAEKTLDAPGRNQLVEFSPDGTILVSDTTSGRTFIWQFMENEFQLTSDISGNPASSLSFSPDGKRLFIGETDEILVFDPLTGGEVNRIRQKGDVVGLSFSPDGNFLAAASLRTIQFFDLLIMKEIPDDDITTAACSRLTRNFNESEWALFFNDEEYRAWCPSLP